MKFTCKNCEKMFLQIRGIRTKKKKKSKKELVADKTILLEQSWKKVEIEK